MRNGNCTQPGLNLTGANLGGLWAHLGEEGTTTEGRGLPSGRQFWGALLIGGLGPQSVPGKPAGIRVESMKGPPFDLWSCGSHSPAPAWEGNHRWRHACCRQQDRRTRCPERGKGPRNAKGCMFRAPFLVPKAGARPGPKASFWGASACRGPPKKNGLIV